MLLIRNGNSFSRIEHHNFEMSNGSGIGIGSIEHVTVRFLFSCIVVVNIESGKTSLV